MKILAWLDALSHRLHLPWWVVCDRFEARLLRSSTDWVDDDNLTYDDVERIFDHKVARGESARTVVPVGFRCQHMSLTIGGDAHFTSRPSTWCGCVMQPIWGNTSRV